MYMMLHGYLVLTTDFENNDPFLVILPNANDEYEDNNYDH